MTNEDQNRLLLAKILGELYRRVARPLRVGSHL